MTESCFNKQNREKLHHCEREKIVPREDMSSLAMNSLYEEKDNDGYLSRDGGGGGYSPIKVTGVLVGKFREHP